MVLSEEMKALLRFLAETAGWDDPVDLVVELLAETVKAGKPAQFLGELVMAVE